MLFNELWELIKYIETNIETSFLWNWQSFALFVHFFVHIWISCQWHVKVESSRLIQATPQIYFFTYRII